MCLILLAWRAHPEYPLVFAANRDEAYERPSAAAEFWRDEPRIFGGRDLEKGGSWLGLTLSGRIAAVTNYRDGGGAKNAPRSRGELVARFLRGTDEPRAYLQRVMSSAGEYGAFSLIVGDLERLLFCSNRAAGIEEVAPGVHGLSNHLLDTPWPKVRHGKERVGALLKAGESELMRGLFEILTDRTAAPDAELPDTGVGLQRERELSPSFVAGERYGTRASTVLLINRRNEVVFSERAFGARGAPLGSVEKRFALEPPPYAVTRDS
ncbi:MAG: NRDE family protein [Betaproteobacteria bacterium]|nr:NRDE family protein [Betaproteobacteria bacterium]